MKKPKIEKIIGFGGIPVIAVNDRYWIYTDNWCVYDTIMAKDIPQYVFRIRDKLAKEKRRCKK